MNSYPNSTNIAREILFKMVTGVVLIFCSAFLYLNVSIQSLAVDTTPVPTLLPYFATPTPQPACSPNCEYLKTGKGYFIVKLKFPYQKEATLTSTQTKEQRTKIRGIQEELITLIQSKRTPDNTYSGEVLASYEAVPYILFAGNNEKLLSLLEKHPDVERLYLDAPLNEVFGMDLDSVPQITGEMLDVAYGKPLPSQAVKDKCYIQSGTDCDPIIQKARVRGSVRVSMMLNLPRELTFKYRNPYFESIQGAAIRQAHIQIFSALQGQRFVINGFFPQYNTLTLTTDVEGMQAILKAPVLNYLNDQTDVVPCICLPVSPNFTPDPFGAD